MNWDREKALRGGKCWTRDGYRVFNIREAVIPTTRKSPDYTYVNQILIGEAATTKPLKANSFIMTTGMFWSVDGFNSNPHKDLVTWYNGRE